MGRGARNTTKYEMLRSHVLNKPETHLRGRVAFAFIEDGPVQADAKVVPTDKSRVGINSCLCNVVFVQC